MLVNFSDCKGSDRFYGGNAGTKLGIIYDDCEWFLKFPQSTKGNRVQEVSYTTSPLSEYLGSRIYEVIGLPVHETKLGLYNGNIVVACKDFIKEGETLIEFSKIKNNYFPGIEELLGSSSNSGKSTDIEELKVIMANNGVFSKDVTFEERFWDMFVVDALIGNKDRNNSNWGFISKNGSLLLAPVYDNGNSFSNKAGDEKISRLIGNQSLLRHSALVTGVCVFSKDGKPINPYKFIGELNESSLNRAVLRIVPNINIDMLCGIIDEVPEEYLGVKVISKVRKEYYKRLLYTRYTECLVPAYRRLVSRKSGTESVRNLIINIMKYEERLGNRYPFIKTPEEVDDSDILKITSICSSNGSFDTLYDAMLKVLGK